MALSGPISFQLYSQATTGCLRLWSDLFTKFSISAGYRSEGLLKRKGLSRYLAAAANLEISRCGPEGIMTSY